MPDFVVCPNIIPKNLCKEIISFAKNKWERGETDKGFVNESIRKSDVVWCSEKKYFELVDSLVIEACKNIGWTVKIDSIEPMQITRYKKGGYYGFHTDGNGFDRVPISNKARKISVSIILNGNFKGGEFEFMNIEEFEYETNAIGTAIIFPSWIPHRVKPVTKGTRYSLVAWLGGEPVI